jgi:hypothetical protein
MTLQEVADKLHRLLQRKSIDQSSAALAWRVAEEGQRVMLPTYCFDGGIFTEACLEYVGKTDPSKRVVFTCEGVDCRASWTDNQGHGTWSAKLTVDGIADLLTAAAFFLM